MKNLLPLLLFIYSGTSFSDDWPNSLIQSTYDGCMKSGGSAQCDCLVTRLRERYDFADMRLAMRDKWAKISLKQSIEAYSVKCLEKKFKEDTLLLKKKLENKSKR